MIGGNMLEEIKNNMNKFDGNLSPYACLNREAIRFFEETDNDFRSPYFRDIDRIIYSLSYSRYSDKTQVYSFIDNDHISKRMTHVQLVSKVARTIGRALNLNEDLIEAAALGHDLGHVPFGHAGESILNKISLENNEGFFNHNVQSVRTLIYLEKNGKGENITLQVLDAIMCHNGEFAMKEYRPKKKSKDEFLNEYNLTYRDVNMVKKLVPMTLEGCVVRISDIIAYIGRDIEDAVRLGYINIDDIPKDITNILGVDNKSTINTLVTDIILNSYGKNYLCMSYAVFEALVKLKQFNYKNIYDRAVTDEIRKQYEIMFRTVFNKSLDALKRNDVSSSIYTVYLNGMSDEYLNNTTNERKVIDYIAGMTDDFFVNQYNILK